MSGIVGQVANLPGQISNLPHDIAFLSPNKRRGSPAPVVGHMEKPGEMGKLSIALSPHSLQSV